MRSRRGFTLLEVVVSTAITAIMILLLARWIVDLGATSQASQNSIGPNRQAQSALALFNADMQAATACDNTGLMAPMLIFTTTDLYVTVADQNGDGFPELVWWSTAGDAVTRTTVPSTGTLCSWDFGTPSQAVLVPHIRTSAEAFTGLSDGTPVTASAFCFMTPDACLFESVNFRFVVEDPAGIPRAYEETTDLPPIFQTYAGTPSTPLAPPGAPAAPSVAAGPGPGTVSVTWVAPATTGAPVTNYIVTALDAGYPAGIAGTNPISVASPTVTVDFPNLIPGRTYTFTVQANSLVGNSAASAASAPIVSP